MKFRKSYLFVVLACMLGSCFLAACVAKEVTLPPNETETPTLVPKVAPVPKEATPPPDETQTSKPVPKIPPMILPTPAEEITLEEAEEISGVPLTPKYLPAGWEFKRGFALNYHPNSSSRPKLILYFSDKEIAGEVRTAQDLGSLTNKKLILNVHPIKEMPSPDIFESRVDSSGGKVVDINGIKVWLSPEGHELKWYLPGLLLVMYISMPEELPAEEIVRIAKSIE